MPRLAAHLQRESHVEKYFKEQCEAHGAIVKKIQRLRGFPDRLIYWFGGVHDVVELKRPVGGVFEPLQLSTHRKLRQREHGVFVIHTKELVDAYIRIRRAYWLPYLLRK